jgi:hypothetical protein
VKGKQFDTLFAPGKGAFETKIGVGMVIRGWDKGHRLRVLDQRLHDC